MASSGLPTGAATSLKSAMRALMVELTVIAVVGAQFGFEASSFFVEEVKVPRLGQAFIVIDSGALATKDVHYEYMETVITEMLVDGGVQRADARRLALARQTL